MTDLVVQEHRHPARVGAGPITPEEWRAISQLATAVANTEFVPRELRGRPEAVLACFAMGRELGIGPMASLKGIAVFDGKPVVSVELMFAVVRAHGHLIETVEKNDRRAVVRGTRKDTGQQEQHEFTIEMAARAGLVTRQNWQKYPEQMLFWRAGKILCSSLFSDVLAGFTLSPDDIGVETDADGRAIVAAQPAAPEVERREPAALNKPQNDSEPYEPQEDLHLAEPQEDPQPEEPQEEPQEDDPGVGEEIGPAFGMGTGEPWPGYDKLNVTRVVQALEEWERGLSSSPLTLEDAINTLTSIKEYEEQRRNRRTVLDALDAITGRLLPTVMDGEPEESAEQFPNGRGLDIIERERFVLVDQATKIAAVDMALTLLQDDEDERTRLIWSRQNVYRKAHEAWGRPVEQVADIDAWGLASIWDKIPEAVRHRVQQVLSQAA